jgi:hypothetical protein
MWRGSGRSLLQTLFLENFKFTLFVITPIVSASFFWNDRIVDAVVRQRQYVTFPPEGERPPTNEEELSRALEARRRARSA